MAGALRPDTGLMRRVIGAMMARTIGPARANDNVFAPGFSLLIHSAQA
jgi:hypothetical protein